MLWRTVVAISLLVAAGWGETPSGAPQSVAPRSPFSRPGPIALLKEVPPAKSAGQQPDKPAANITAQAPAQPAAKPGAAVVKPAAGDMVGQARLKPAVAITTKPAAPSPLPPREVVAEVRKVVNARDPFMNPIHVDSGLPGCTGGGKRCLVIDRIMLKGVVRSESGFIAVVVNSANRAFFLRVNDPLWNGYVVRITGNAVTFRENGKDRLGHPTSREVTKIIGRPSA